MRRAQQRTVGSSVIIQGVDPRSASSAPTQAHRNGLGSGPEGEPGGELEAPFEPERSSVKRVEAWCLDFALRHGLFCADLRVQCALAHASADLTSKTLRFDEDVDPARAALYARVLAQVSVILWDLDDEAALRCRGRSLAYRDALAMCFNAAWTAPLLPDADERTPPAELDALARAARRALDEAGAAQGSEPIARAEDWHSRLWAATRETRALLSVDLELRADEAAPFDRSLREHIEARRAAWAQSPRGCALPPEESERGRAHRDSIATLLAFGLMARAAERARRPGDQAAAEGPGDSSGGSALGAILELGARQADLTAWRLNDLVALLDDVGDGDGHASRGRADALTLLHLHQERSLEQLGDICRSLRYLAALRADEGYDDAASLLDAATVYADVARGYCDWVMLAPRSDQPLRQSLLGGSPSSRRRASGSAWEREKGSPAAGAGAVA